MAVAYQAAGAISNAASGSITPALPAHATNDIFLLAVCIRAVADTLSISGWAQLATGDRGVNARYWWFWKRAASGAEADPTLSPSVGLSDIAAKLYSIRGAITTEDPFEVVGTLDDYGTVADPQAMTGLTTLTNGALVLASMVANNDSAASVTITATDPSGLTAVYDDIDAALDYAFVIGHANRATAGATGSISFDFDAAPGSGGRGLAFSIKPAPAGATGNPHYAYAQQ